MKEKTEFQFRISKELKNIITEDLSRVHEYAYERVGFILTRTHWIGELEIVLAYDYKPVLDKNYIKDNTVGARINSLAIKEAMEISLAENCGIFHVHVHSHLGKPMESSSDIIGIIPMIESVARINRKEKFGYLILSDDSALCKVHKAKGDDFIEVKCYSEIGYPMNFIYSENVIDKFNLGRQKRQNFLGEKAPLLMKKIKIAIIGYGGGGSHIGQQLAHIGFENVIVFEPDFFEESNINRLIGSKEKDIKNKTPKVDIAKRTIKGILPNSKVHLIKKRWQEEPEELQQVDVVIGGVDSFIERQQLEAECRRYLIPLIDIGMDVYDIDNSYAISGQVILSMPNKCCMECFGFMTQQKLAIEASKYGNIGGNPQVVWSNGVLASTAVGVMVDLLFGWSNLKDRDVYLSYDGNLGLVKDHSRLKYKPDKCKHYPISQIGPAIFKRI